MSNVLPSFNVASLRWLAPLVTFAAVLAVLALVNREPETDPVSALGPAVSTDAVAPATASAITSLESAIRAEPDSATAYGALGDTYLQAARESADSAFLERAEGAFTAVERRDPESVVAAIGQGTLALAGHEFPRGLELGRRAHEQGQCRVDTPSSLTPRSKRAGRRGRTHLGARGGP